MKNRQADSFSGAPAAFGTGLRLGAKETRLSPAQQRLAKLLARIDKLKSQIADLQALGDTYRPLYDSTLEPLRARHQALARRMALWLDERLDRKGLSPTQKRATTEILCSLCEMLASEGDEAMAALHDKHSAQSLRQKEEQGADDLRAIMESMLGQPLDLRAQDESLDPLEAVLRASHEQLHQAAQAEQEKYEAAQARRQKKPTAAQRKAEQQQEDADTVLRQVYRQLASALHPDRERDPIEQRRKTALMSEANAAYGRQDLVALLHLQLRIAQSDTQDLLQQPEERIAAMSVLLRQQAGELEQELFARQEQLERELGLEYTQKLTASTLDHELALQQEDLEADLQAMEADLTLVQQDDAGFKRWLKEQARLSRQPDYF
ncbi:MAG: DnaJ domain protein [Polaromonas sp.]|nr:DnaJ domain protein [Polaromonas sp.]